MVWDRTNRALWLRCTGGVIIAILAAAFRCQFLGVLGLHFTFLTFFPAVAVAALYGGFAGGLMATVISAALANYFWMEPVGQFAIVSMADLIGMITFLSVGAFISYLAETAFRAQARAYRAEEQSKSAAQREKAAVELQQSESKYRELVQNANSAIIRIKRDGAISFFNEYAQKFFGYSAEEVIGKHVSILLPERESTGASLTELFRNVLDHPERHVNNVNENVLRDGGRVWMAWTNRPVFDQEGQLVEILAVGSDITDRRRAEQEIQFQNAVMSGINRIFREALTCDTEEDLGRTCLSVVEELTKSKLGFIGEIGADGLFHDIAISDPGREFCSMYDKTGHRRPHRDLKIHGLYGQVLEDGRSLLTNDPYSHPDSIGTPDGHPALTAFLGVPLKQDGKTIGSVGLGNREGGYAPEHQQAVEAVAPAIVQALFSKRAEQALAADLRALTRMHELSVKLLAAGGLQTLLQEIIDAAVMIVDAQMGTLQLFEDDSLRIVAAHGHVQPFLDFFASAEKTASVCGEAIRRGERVVVPDVETSSLFAGTTSLAALREAGIRAVQSTPIMSRTGALLGILTTQWKVPYTPDEHDLRRIDLLARQAADMIDHSRAEKELRESEERFRALVQASSDAVYRMSPDWSEMRQLHGRDFIADTQDPSSTWLQKYILPDDQPYVWATIDEAIRHKSIFELEHRILRVDGSLGWAASRAIPIMDAKGEILEWFGTASNVTERRKMEEDLRLSRDELELRVRERTDELVKANEELREKAEIIDFAHDAIILRDTESRIVFWSKGAQETYGFTREEALGRVSHELLKTAFPVAAEDIEETVLKKREWKGELRHTKANGERIVVDSRWAVQVGRDGEPTGFLEVNRDITARKIAEEEFRQADRALRTLSQCNQAMVRQTEEMELLRQVCRTIVDVGGYRMTWVGFAKNDENKSVLPVASAGYDDGYLDQARITWADTGRGRGPTGTVIRSGKMFILQNSVLNPLYEPWRPEAIRRGYASSISLPLIVEGNVIGALGIYASEPDAFDEGEAGLLSNLAENLSFGIASIREAEKRRLAEEELRIYASRLEVINKELQDFAFVAAHDLQEPLRKIQTFCDLAIRRCASDLDATGRQYLDRVVNSAGRMRKLLHDLLEFSRVAAKPEPFQKIDLGIIVREAADVFEAFVRETGCRIEIENIPAIEADQSQMLQLFQNLIGNSLKFRREETPHIEVYGKSARKGICEIFVKDNGIGFEQEFAERIFKPFYKLHGRDEYEGTGIGLAVCRKIVERHGGTIKAESRPGKGSTFIIRIPAKQASPENAIAG
jgi:PAS domain S-box-containing protein